MPTQVQGGGDRTGTDTRKRGAWACAVSYQGWLCRSTCVLYSSTCPVVNKHAVRLRVDTRKCSPSFTKSPVDGGI